MSVKKSSTSLVSPNPLHVLHDKSVIIIGSGLAGLSSAVSIVDEVYNDVYTQCANVLSSTKEYTTCEDVFAYLSRCSDSERDKFYQSHPAFSAALQKAYLLDIHVLEKEKTVGGNSQKASSGINAVNTQRQEDWYAYHDMSAKDTLDAFVKDTQKSCFSPEPPLWKPLTDTEVSEDASLPALSPYTSTLVHSLVNNSVHAVKYLENMLYTDVLPIDDNKYPEVELDGSSSSSSSTNGKLTRTNTTDPNVKLSGPLYLSTLSKLGGHSMPRTHRVGVQKLGDKPPPFTLPVGVALISELKSRIHKAPYNKYIKVHTSTTVRSITRDTTTNTYTIRYSIVGKDGTEETHDISTKTIVFATGGYSGSSKHLEKYAPELAKLQLSTTNGPWTTGDHVDMIEGLGGQVISMHAVQVHPSGFIDPNAPHAKSKFLAPEALRGSGGMLLNTQGKTFVNELHTRDVVARHIYWQDHHVASLVLTEDAANKFGIGPLKFYASKSLVKPVTKDMVETLAKYIQHNKYTTTDIPTLYTMLTSQKDFHMDTSTDSSSTTTLTPESTRLATSLYLAYYGAVQTATPFAEDPVQVVTNIQTSLGTEKGISLDTPSSWYVMGVTPSIHYSMGGIAVDVHGRALTAPHITQAMIEYRNKFHTEFDKDYSQLLTWSQQVYTSAAEEDCVPGVYAVGEAAGGYHGQNRLGGNSLLECIVSSQSAAKHIFKHML